MEEANTKKPYLYLAAIVVLVLAAVAAALFVVRGSSTETNEPAVEPVASSPSPETTEVVVTYGTEGFNPDTAIVATGTVVTFENLSDSPVWPASAAHPTHTAYPGSGIDRCGTDEEDFIFDSCRGLIPGESYSFLFGKVGEWGYHNHLSPSDTGRIIVQ